MSDKKNTAPTTGSTAPETSVKNTVSSGSGDSNLELQELLRKYLPEFAEESTQKAPSAEEEEYAPEETADESLTEDVPVKEEEPEVITVVEEEDPFEPKKKKGLFARLFSSKKKEEENADVEAPDGALFEQISAETSDAAEQAEDDDIRIAESSEEDDDVRIAEFASEETEQSQAVAVEEIPSETAQESEDVQPETEAEETLEASPADDDLSRLMIALGLDSVPAEQQAAEPEQTAAEEEQEMDETVQNLLVGLGMEDQLDEKAGKGTAAKTVAKNDADARVYEEQQRRAMEYEYTERAQTPRIAEAYRYTLNSLKIKVLAAAVLTLILFFYENISLFGIQFAGPLDPAVYPVVYIMVSLQIMLLVCAVAYEQIFTGIRNLITGQPTPESVTAVLAAFGVLYSSFAALVSAQGNEPVMYNFAVAVCALMSLIFAFLNTKREVFSFNIVSSKKKKYIFRRIPGTEACPESEAFASVSDDAPDVLQIEHTAFVDGYFGRTSVILHSTRVYVMAMLTVVGAAAVLLAVFSALGGSGAADAVAIAYVSVLAAIPMSMFFTYSYPFYKANREAFEMDSTIVGESSLEEYSGASIISFDDNNVFPSSQVKVQNIKIESGYRIDRVLYYAASAFDAAGGPLSVVFELATKEIGISADSRILSAGAGYLESEVDGHRVLFGRSAVLTELGVRIPEEVVEEDSYIEGDLSIMYMVVDGRYVAKMFIRYIIDPDFDFIVSQFANNGTCVCVKTLDPNVDEEMIFSKMKGRKYPLKVVKLNDGDGELERAESGIVTRSTTKSLLQVVSLCDMVLSVKRTNMIISVIAALVTLVIMFIVAMSGSLSMIGSGLVVLNQLFWMIPAILTTKLFIK